MVLPYGNDLRDREGVETNGERRVFWSNLHYLHLFRYNEGQEEKDKNFLSHPDCTEKLTDVLKNAGWDVLREGAVRLLAMIEGQGIDAILKKGLVDESFEIRLQAAHALLDHGDKSGIPVLLKELKGGFTKKGIEAAAFLCVAGNEKGLVYLLGFLDTWPSSAKISSDTYLQDGNGGLHSYNDAALALAKIGHKNALSYLLNAPYKPESIVEAVSKISKMDALPLVVDDHIYTINFYVNSEAWTNPHPLLVELFGKETVSIFGHAAKGSDKDLSKLCKMDHPHLPYLLQGIARVYEEKKKSTQKNLAEIQARLDKVKKILGKSEKAINPLAGKDAFLDDLHFAKGKSRTKRDAQKPAKALPKRTRMHS